MLLTIALSVLAVSTVILFSTEFYDLFKKIASIKGVPLLLPLAIMSWFAYTFDYWLLWAMYYYRECLQAAVAFLSYLIPFKTIANSLSLIVLLTVSAVGPVFVADWHFRSKKYLNYHYSYLTSFVIWLVNSILLVITVVGN